MPRNDEVISQGQFLLHAEREQPRSHRRGDGAGEMVALQEAGFPLTSEEGADRRTPWILSLPLQALHAPGLSVVELWSPYISRALLAAMPVRP